MLLRLIKQIVYECISRTNPIWLSKRQGVTIGEDCRLINYPSWGSEPYLITIGNHVTIASNVTFITHDGSTWVFRNKPEFKKVLRYGRIKIGNNCFIGAGVTIMPGVEIGNDCIVGAASLVKNKIPDGEVWAGVPAKYLCKTEDFAYKCLKETPEYDEENYNTNKKEEILKMTK